MKSYEETTRSVTLRVNQYREKKKQRRKEILIISSVAAVFVIVAGVLVFGVRGRDKDRFVRSDPYNDEVKQSDQTTPDPTAAPTESAAPDKTQIPSNTPDGTSQPTTKPTNTPKQTAKPTPTPRPTTKPTSTPKPTANPTTTPKPTPTPSGKPTPTPTANPTSIPTSAPTDPPGEPIEYDIGRHILATEKAFNKYYHADNNTELTFKFQSTRNPKSSKYVKDFRHNGMTFDEWEHETWQACEEAQEIYIYIRDNNIKVEYGVDISKYPWTQRAVYKSEYGEYYPYLPPEWYELMDFYVTNNDAYWEAWDECMYKQAQDEAAFFGKFAVSVRIESNGDKVRGYHLVATITKGNIDNLSNALEYTFRMDVC